MESKYYMEMLKRDRAFPVYINKKLKCYITYFIGNGDHVSKYVRSDPWSIVDDEPETGTVCYIDQCISSKENENQKYNRIVFGIFINHIKEKFPQVKMFRWNRVKNKIVNIYKKEI